MTYLESLNALGQARRFGMKLGLGTMHALAEGLGSPHKELRFIHLAGTNGKGSTSAFVESGLRAAGHRTGLFTSPHLVSPRERIQVNREPISEELFAQGMATVFKVASQKGIEPTFFELMAALALWHFSREKVDWVVWETGLGGRLDATSIVWPEVAIITHIGLDHEKWLGNTLGEIAAEKAGILKSKEQMGGREMSLICGEKPGEAREVITKKASELGISYQFIWDDPEIDLQDLGFQKGVQWARIAGQEFALGLRGPHQTRNAACAYAALRKLGVEKKAISQGFATTEWAARFDILSTEPTIVLDGAHNLAGAEELVQTWTRYLQSIYGWSPNEILGRAHLVFSAVVDKDIDGMIRLLRPLASQVSLVQMKSDRAASPSFLMELFAGLPMTVYGSTDELWNTMKTDTRQSPVLIAGSLFLAGEILAAHRGQTGEYQMNELLEETVTGKSYGPNASNRL